MMKQPQRNDSTPKHLAVCRTLLFTLIAVSCQAAVAAEVYTWTDADGVVHFSDAPPESGKSATIQVDEIYRPGSADAYSKAHDAPTDTAATTGEAASEEPVKSVAQQRREQILRDRTERQQEAAEAERLCALHRQRLEQMEPARRVFYTDEQGESVRMDDDRRMALIDESKQYLASNCRN